MMYYVDNVEIVTLLAGILCAMPIFKNMIYVENKAAKLAVNVWLMVLFILSSAAIAASTYNPFIYFRF